MRYRITQIKTDPRKTKGEPSDDLLRNAIARKVRSGLRPGDIRNIEIVRESVDARKKPDVRLVYTLDFDCDKKLHLDKAEYEKYQVIMAESFTGTRPVIAGFGPCGMFASLILAEAGMKPLVIERGRKISERVADVESFLAGAGTKAPDPESNVQFGEGGAGTFSDGKLTTGIRDSRIRKVLEELVEAGADPQILYKQKPHIGTDRLRQIVPEIRHKIESLGGEVVFGCRLDGLDLEDGRLKGINITREGRAEYIETDTLVLAIGHSARDTFGMLHDKGFAMEQKPFSIGVRIEHSQDVINESQYGDASLAEILGPADYKLSCRCESGRGVYTFCMCPGGQVINASTEAETSVTNGMSLSRRDSGTANSGLLVDVRTSDFGSDHPLAGIEFQKKYEKLAWENRTEAGMARSTYGKFRNSEDPVRKSLPDFASDSILEAMPVFGRRIRGFDSDDAVMTAVETRSSSPVRIKRDENMQAAGFKGVIPAGEGPGYAGGIMSAAVDGIKAAEKIILWKK